MVPTDGLEQRRSSDAIEFGAVGAPDIPDHFTLWGPRLLIDQGFDQYANVRSARIVPEVPTRSHGERVGISSG